jgi:opacity protein-like surface antigen
VRSPTPPRSILTGIAVLLAALNVAALAAPAADADTVDESFLKALQSKQITFASGQAAVVAGHQVCDALDGGRASSDVANDVMQQSGLDGYHAGFFVGVSIAAFCPRHTGA